MAGQGSPCNEWSEPYQRYVRSRTQFKCQSLRPKGSLEVSHALASQVTGWLLATQARVGMTGEARACLAALDDERANSGEVRNADAVICLAEGNPAAALAAMQDVLDGTAPVVGYVTVVVTHLLAGFAHRQLGDQRAANQAAERALGLAEADRLVRSARLWSAKSPEPGDGRSP